MAYKRLRKSYRRGKKRAYGGGFKSTILRARRMRAIKQKMCCYKPEVKFQTIAFTRLIYNRSTISLNLYSADSLTGTNNLLYTIGVGTTGNARIGDQIYLKSIGIRMIIIPLVRTNVDPPVVAANADAPILLRISLIAIQKVNLGTVEPALIKVFGNNTPESYVSRYYDRSDVNVYFDKVYSIAPSSWNKTIDGAASNQPNIFFKKNIKFNRKVIFDDQLNNNGIPKLNKNNLYWVAYAYRPGFPTDLNVINVTGQIRVYFTDA